MLIRMQYEMVRNSGLAIRSLLDELQDEHELFASRNTLALVELHLLVMAQTLAHLAPPLLERLLRVDWAGWRRLLDLLENDGQPRREAVWYAISALVPATLDMLASLRRSEPAWFEIGY